MTIENQIIQKKLEICLFDPSIQNSQGLLSTNLGDLIIREAVKTELDNLFPNSKLVSIATHTFPSTQSILTAKDCTYSFVGGTNLLNSDIGKKRKRQWKFTLPQQMLVNKCILLGVGWQKYEASPNLQSCLILKTILSKKMIHSVRDSYTREKLQSAGINNVLNTNCPTMWPFLKWNWDDQNIPSEKSENVLIMLTDYWRDLKLDRKLLELLAAKYKRIFVWPQGINDREYVIDLAVSLQIQVTILEHSLESLNNFIDSDISFDYIGTRLHGGIKCLLSHRKSLIIEIDNRAREIAKDTNLPTVARSNLLGIIQWIESPSSVKIELNNDDINQWKSQFG
jgi:polysaccharide pyruvyl transferase WcaK-like protein